MSDPTPTGTLYIVATPIGNYEDMTIRALAVLRSADVIVYEERREGEKLLAHLSVSGKEVGQLNEHNEASGSDFIMGCLAQGRNVALISDAGTPVFADPGGSLIRRAIERGIRIVPIPGASSLLPALVGSGLPTDRFLYYGFLSPKTSRRQEELRSLAHEERTIVLMDTPYRLVALLRNLTEVFGPERRACVAFNLTMSGEKLYRDPVGKLLKFFEAQAMKGEFVIVIEGARRI